MSRPKMSTWTLGAIMVIVPTSFYLGTALNRHYAITQPSTSSVPSFTQTEGVQEDPMESVTTPTSSLPPQMSVTDEMAVIQSRLKSLKTSRMTLEMELKDNKDKLKRLEERMRREG